MNEKINPLNTDEQRLQKFLAAHGVASRRAAEQLILAGRISVNGAVVTEMGVKVCPGKDVVCLDGCEICALPQKRYILLNKPGGYICSVSDERGRRTVLDLLNDIEERVYPVGRLDYDTLGLLLLTNDGELTNRLLHPSHQVEKTYLAEVDGIPSYQSLQKLRKGVLLSDGMTAPAKVEIVRKKGKNARVEVTIHEGRNRQVRRMLEHIGHPVLHLKRTKLAFLTLEGVSLGSWRELTTAEVRALYEL